MLEQETAVSDTKTDNEIDKAPTKADGPIAAEAVDDVIDIEAE